MQTCCVREAEMDGRRAAAHGLFQTALMFFERAKVVALPGDEGHLRDTWKELDARARCVYTTDVLLDMPAGGCFS